MSRKKHPKQISKARKRREAARAALSLLVGWDEERALTWDEVAQLVGSDGLVSAGITNHREDCEAVAEGMGKDDIWKVGEILVGGSGSVTEVIARYLGPVQRSVLAAEWHCPQYVLGDEALITHERYHELLDEHKDLVAWNRSVREQKAARRDLASVQKATDEAMAAGVVGYRQVREDLGLAAWQMEQAFASGLFTAGVAKNGVLAEEYEAAVADKEAFTRRLAREDKINAGEGAQVL